VKPGEEETSAYYFKQQRDAKWKKKAGQLA